VTGKVYISSRAYEGLRVILSGDPIDVLAVGLASRHLVRLPTMSNGPSEYSTVSKTMVCDSARFFP
jgi:hypothetical protein